MISVFVDFFNFVGAFINFLLNFSYYLGKLLVALGVWTFELIKTISINLSDLCVILYEDFSYFSSDIWIYIETIGTTINNGFKSVIDGIVHAGSNVTNAVTKIITDGGFKITNLFKVLSDFTIWCLFKVKEFLLLLGNGTWFLITLLPKLLLTISHVCWKACQDLWENLKEACRVTSNRISVATKSAYNYFIDVPLHCAIGLVVLYLVFRYRYKIFRKIMSILQGIYNVIQQYSHEFNRYRISRRQRRVQVQEGEETIELLMATSPPLFAPSNGPTARKPLRRSPRNPKREETKTSLTQSSLSCVVCLDRKKTVVVLPCRHLCLCTPCSRQLPNFQNSCPLCRNEISETIETYI
uniref:CSON013591 protein n=1 Tax=Culicoides sonorensis TaxID=179676 RepID=A0A336KQ72_CULSO